MSAAILMTGNTEQTSVRAPSSEHGGTEIASFAQSFDENVGNNAGVTGGRIHDGAAVEHRGMQADATKTIGVTTPAGPGKIKAVVDEDAVGEGGKTETKGKSVVQGSDVKVGPQNGSLTKGVEVTGHAAPEVESTAEMAEVSQGVPKPSVDGDPVGTAPAPTTDSSVESQTLISKSEEVVVVQKEVGVASAKADETGPVKKTGKTKESSATKAGHKATEAGLKTSGGETKLSAQPSVQASAPAALPAPVANGAPASVVSKVPESGRDDGVSVASKPVQLSAGLGGAPIQTSSASSSGTDAHGGGSNVVANETGVPAAAMPDGQVEASKLNATAPPSTASGIDADGKAQTAVAAAMHVMGAGAGTSSGLATTMFSPAGVSVDGSFAKLPVGGAAAHGTNLGTMSTGSDGSSALTPGSMDGAPKTLEATPTALEIGMQNGTHGWLKVRAEMTDSGVVNASVSTATAAGQEMLHRELPALTAYLHEEKVAVNMVVVHAPTTAGGEFRGSSAGAGDGAGGQAAGTGGQQQSFGRTASGRAGETTGQRSWDGDGEDGLPSNATYAEGGSWLSVRA